MVTACLDYTNKPRFYPSASHYTRASIHLSGTEAIHPGAYVDAAENKDDAMSVTKELTKYLLKGLAVTSCTGKILILRISLLLSAEATQKLLSAPC